MKVQQWFSKHTESLKGKRVAVSGATGGIGQPLCEYLAELGADLVLLDRNRNKSDALKERLQAKFPKCSVHQIRLDLEDISSVKEAVSALSMLPPDVLIFNAGAYHIPRHRCSTGLDNVFQINFASPYYMARSLQPILQKRGGRIVAVGSIAHTYSYADWEDIDFSRCKASSKAYGNAKRFLMFSLYGLYAGQTGLAVTHPGITFTNITNHYPKLIFAVIKHPMKVIFMKPKKACLSILQGVFEDCGQNEWIGPKWFQVWGLPKKKRLNSCSKEEADRIFATAEELYRKMAE